MARIPIYSQQTTPSGSLDVRVIEPDVSSGLETFGRTLGAIGQDLAAKEQAKKLETDKLEIAKRTSQAELDLTKKLDELKSNYQPGSDNYPEQVFNAFEEYKKNAVQGFQTIEGEQAMHARLDDLRSSMGRQAIGWQSQETARYKIAGLDEIRENYKRAVLGNPGDAQRFAASYKEAVDSLQLAPEYKRDASLQAMQEIAWTAERAIADQNPNAAFKQGSRWSFDALPAERQQQLIDYAQQQKKQREIEARQYRAIAQAELSSRIADVTAANFQGLQYDDPPSSGEIIAAFGPERGSRIVAGLQRSAEFGQDIKEYATLPIEERNKWLEMRAPAIGGIATEGFAEETKIYGQLLKNAQAMNQQLVEDGAGYAIKYSPGVNAAWQAVTTADEASAPGAYQAYAEAAKGEQQRLGLTGANVLPKAYVSKVAAAFKAPENAGPRQMALIQEMQSNWGKHFPDVFRQISKEVPDSVKIIGSGVDSDTATILSSIANVDTKTLKAPLPSTDVRLMDNELKASLEPFRKTFAVQAGGSETFNSVYSEAYRGALSQMAVGKSASEAAQDMATRLQANYKVDGSLRVPSSYDIDTIQVGAQAAIRRLTPNDILLGEIPGISEEFKTERFGRLMQSATFVTNKNEDGLFLMINGGAVLGKDGRPLDFKFDDLLGLAAEKDSSAVDMYPPGTFGGLR